MKMTVTFPGATKVDAHFKGFDVRTDQPLHAGGEGAAPAPFDYFLASIGTCAGYYVASFLRKRDLPVDDVVVHLETEKDPETKMIAKVRLTVALPANFPDKYKPAIERAIDLCSVKKHLFAPPAFETVFDTIADPDGAFPPDRDPVSA